MSQKTGKLILPGQNSSNTPPPEEEIELLPSELNDVRELAASIQEKYGFKPFDATSEKHFENEVTQRFAEIGIVVKIYWKDVDVDGEPTSDKLYFVPTIAMVGRTEKKPMDHERYAVEVQSGELDGKVGTVRPDGTLGDPTKKLIV